MIELKARFGDGARRLAMYQKEGRQMISKRSWLILLSIFIVVGLAFLARNDSLAESKGSKETIRIGMSVSTTGSYKFASQQGLKGVKIWIDEVNSFGGINVKEYGKKLPVELVYYDDRSEKGRAVRLYEKLIVEDKVDTLFSPFGSTLTSAVAPIAEKHGKFLCIWSAAADSIYEQGHKCIVSATEAPTSIYVKPPMEHMAFLKVKTVAFLFADEPYLVQCAKHARRYAEEFGMEVTEYEKFPPGLMDYTPLLHKIRQSDPDALYVGAYDEGTVNILRQMRELNIMFDHLAMEYSAQPQFLDVMGKDGLYVFGRTNFHKDLIWKVSTGYNLEEFTGKYEELFPDAEYPPDFQTSQAYGAAEIMGLIIEKAGTLKVTDMRKAANELSGNVTILPGPYKIDAKTGAQLGIGYSITQIQEINGKLKTVIVWPHEVATKKDVYPIPPWEARK